MFGHALSKGVDIDKNGYKDFAVGAPNSEKVYVFKSYPVIRIKAEMSAIKEKIKLESTIPIKMCLHFETDSRKIFNYDISELNLLPNLNYS